MSEPVITVDGDASARDAVNLMLEKNIGALLVSENGRPEGIVTDRDILRKCSSGIHCGLVKVREIMSKPLVTIDQETPIGMALKVMTENNIRRLMVTEDGEITGIVTERDLMKGTLEALRILDTALSSF